MAINQTNPLRIRIEKGINRKHTNRLHYPREIKRKTLGNFHLLAHGSLEILYACFCVLFFLFVVADILVHWMLLSTCKFLVTQRSFQTHHNQNIVSNHQIIVLSVLFWFFHPSAQLYSLPMCSWNRPTISFFFHMNLCCFIFVCTVFDGYIETYAAIKKIKWRINMQMFDWRRASRVWTETA